MNPPSPLIPQGTLPPRGNSSFFFKVMLTLAIHVVIIGVLLLQGCKDTKETVAVQTLPDAAPIVGVPVVEPSAPAPTTTTASQPKVLPATPAHNLTQQPPAIQPPSPPPTVIAPAAPPIASADSVVYKVKPGDTLSKIARSCHTSYKKIMAMNDLTTTTVKPGQILKLPASKPVAIETPQPATVVLPVRSTASVTKTAVLTPAMAVN